MANLMVIQGASEYSTLELYTRSSIGRAPHNTHPIPDPSLAPADFEIVYRGDKYLLNGLVAERVLFVNGEAVEGHRSLENGDIIQAGNVQFLFCDEDMAEPIEAPDGPGDLSQFDPLGSSSQTGPIEQIQARAAVGTSGGAIRQIAAIQSDEARRRLETLFEVTSTIAEIRRPDDLLPRLLDIVFQVFPAQTGSIWLLEDERIRVKAARDCRGRVQSRARASKTILREAIRTREAILTSDAMSDDRFLSGQSIIDQDIHSAMCVPLIYKEEVLGVVQIETSDRMEVFSQEDLDFLCAIGTQAAVALKNAQLFEAITEKERIEHELALASRIQQSLLPQSPPEVEGLSVTGRIVPAREIGGDYFDFLPAPDSRGIYIAVGDVTGKGLPAGLVMVMARSLLLPLVEEGLSTRDIVVRANRHLYGNTDRKTFMTMSLLRWDPGAGRLVYTGAGHEHIILASPAQDRPRVFRTGGMALGISDKNDDAFVERQIPFEPGDSIVLYTDGVTESLDPRKEQFGLDRLVRTVQRLKNESPEEIVSATLARVAEFTQGAEPYDDITLVVLRRTA